MQSRIVKSVELFEEFSRVYRMADYNIITQADLVLRGATATFFLTESYGTPLTQQEQLTFKDYTIDSYKKTCVEAIYAAIASLKEDAESELETLTKTLQYRYFRWLAKTDNVKQLKDSIFNMEKYLNDKQLIISRISFNYEYLNETIKIPFYRFSKGQKIYLVIQDPQHFMKVQSGIVTRVSPIETVSDSGTFADFEFEYDIEVDNKVTHVTYQSLRSFDGIKCMVNYNYTLFTNIDDAKYNCKKVLNGLQLQIETEIKKVDDFDD
jgi:hypothetical protein